MDLGKINRDSEDRAVWWAVAVTALLGVTAMLNASSARLEGDPLAGRVAAALA